MIDLGFLWVSDSQYDIIPGDGFENPDGSAKPLSGRLLATVPTAQALRTLLRLWKDWQNDEALGRGKGGIRDLFENLKDLRRWGAKDRLQPAEEYLREALAEGGDDGLPPPYRHDGGLFLAGISDTRCLSRCSIVTSVG